MAEPSDPSFRRLARRAGVKRIAALVTDDARSALGSFLRRSIEPAVTYADHRRARTLAVQDVVHALTLTGHPIYGFGAHDAHQDAGPAPRARRAAAVPAPAAPRRSEDAWLRDARHAPTVGHGVSVRASLVPGAGRGLFVDRAFGRGAVLTEYAGARITRAQADRRRAADPAAASHMRRTGDQRWVIDGLRVPVVGEGGASFANQAPGHRSENNAVFRNIGDRVYLIATKPLARNQEVFTWYGTDYVWA